MTKVYQGHKPSGTEDSSTFCISFSHPQLFLGVVPRGQKPRWLGNVGPRDTTGTDRNTKSLVGGAGSPAFLSANPLQVLHCFQPTPVPAFGTSHAPHSLPNQYRCFNTHQNPDNYKQNQKTGQSCFLLIAWTLSCSQARCFPLSDIAFKDIFVGHIANTHFMIRGMSRSPNQDEDHTMPADV